MLHVYPSYVQTNISKNAMVGDCQTYGKTDADIKKGIPVSKAVRQIIIAMHLKRHQIIIGNLFYQLAPKILFLSETLTMLAALKTKKKQMKKLEDLKHD